MSANSGPGPRAEIQPGWVPRRAAGTEFTRLGADFILLDPDGSLLRGLNRTGARVWELADGERSVAEIARLLAEESRAPAESVQADVISFVKVLFQKRLFSAGNEGGAS